MEKRCLLPLVGAERRRFRRADVESLAASWMTAREAAARLGVEARHLWRVVERHNLTCRMGHGFYLREELEEVVRVEMNGLAVFSSLAGERAGERFQ
jgi:hypothetical protein